MESRVDTVYVDEWPLPSRGCYNSPMYNFRGRVKEQGFMEITNNIVKIAFLFLFTLNFDAFDYLHYSLFRSKAIQTAMDGCIGIHCP